jgi:hypothetical protein
MEALTLALLRHATGAALPWRLGLPIDKSIELGLETLQAASVRIELALETPQAASVRIESVIEAPHIRIELLLKAFDAPIELLLELFDAPIEFALEPIESLEHLLAETFEREFRVLTLLDEVLGHVVETTINRFCQRVQLALDAIDPLRQWLSVSHFSHASLPSSCPPLKHEPCPADQWLIFSTV